MIPRKRLFSNYQQKICHFIKTKSSAFVSFNLSIIYVRKNNKIYLKLTFCLSKNNHVQPLRNIQNEWPAMRKRTEVLENSKWDDNKKKFQNQFQKLFVWLWFCICGDWKSIVHISLLKFYLIKVVLEAFF